MSTQNNNPELKDIIRYYNLDNYLERTLTALINEIKSKYGDNATQEQASSIYENTDFIGTLISYWGTSFREASIVDKYLENKLLIEYLKGSNSVRIDIEDSTDYLEELVDYLSDNLNGLVIKNDKDSYYKEHTIAFDYDVINDNGVVCRMIYTYPNGNQRYETFHIISNKDGEFQIDSTNNLLSPYNVKYHISWFSNKEEILQFIKSIENID